MNFDIPPKYRSTDQESFIKGMGRFRFTKRLATETRVANPVTGLEIIQDRHRFEAVRNEWDELAAHFATPLASHDWYLAALDARAERFELCICVIWRSKKIVAAAPFGMERNKLGRRLVAIDSFSGEPDRLLYSDIAALQDLAKAVTDLRKSLIIRRLPAQGPEGNELANALRKRAFFARRASSTSAFVDIREGFNALERRMSRNRRSTIRRKARAATASHGPMTVDSAIPKPHEVQDALTRLIQIENSGWKRRQGTSIAADPRMSRFIHALSQRFAKKGCFRVIFLRFGDRDVACRFILEWKDSWFEIKIGYDEDFSTYSPGIQLMHETLRAACEAGMARYEFLGVYEDWQDHWPRELREYELLTAYDPNLSGVGSILSDIFRLARNRLSILSPPRIISAGHKAPT